jgi:imidazolonepropionase-like amidohydrolase
MSTCKIWLTIRSAIIFLVFFNLPTQGQSQPRPQVIAIRAGQLLDPETAKVTPNQTIIVRGSVIEQIGSEISIPSDALVVDLSNSVVLPGLFDAHTHLCMTVIPERDAGDYFITTIRDATPYRAIEGVANGQAMLQSGFTTIRDVGNAGNYADTALRKAIEDGWVQGPTVVNAGKIIAPYGGQFHLQPEKKQLGDEYLFADTRDEMRKAIRENIHFGAKLIKIVVDDQPYIYSVEDIRFMVGEAHSAGLKLAAHCWTHAGAHNAAEAGVDSIEHGFRMTDDDLELAKKNKVTLVGTEFPERTSASPGDHKVWVDRLRRAYKIGVNLVFGTDVIVAIPGETRGTLAIDYITSWVEAGVTSQDTLRAMTANAARLVGLDNERGHLRPGFAADIIATSLNPEDDIKNLRTIVFVMKNGVIVKR